MIERIRHGDEAVFRGECFRPQLQGERGYALGFFIKQSDDLSSGSAGDVWGDIAFADECTGRNLIGDELDNPLTRAFQFWQCDGLAMKNDRGLRIGNGAGFVWDKAIEIDGW